MPLSQHALLMMLIAPVLFPLWQVKIHALKEMYNLIFCHEHSRSIGKQENVLSLCCHTLNLSFSASLQKHKTHLKINAQWSVTPLKTSPLFVCLAVCVSTRWLSDITWERHVWHRSSLSITNVEAVLTCQSWLLVPTWQIRCCSSSYQRWMFAWKRGGNCASNYCRHQHSLVEMTNTCKRDCDNLIAGGVCLTVVSVLPFSECMQAIRTAAGYQAESHLDKLVCYHRLFVLHWMQRFTHNN